jgi:hypothetical protein
MMEDEAVRRRAPRPPWLRRAFENKPLIDMSELAKASGISEDILRDHIRAGRLHYSPKGHGTKRVHRQFGEEHVTDFLRQLQKSSP